MAKPRPVAAPPLTPPNVTLRPYRGLRQAASSGGRYGRPLSSAALAEPPPQSERGDDLARNWQRDCGGARRPCR
jgi:hypothetical protein